MDLPEFSKALLILMYLYIHRVTRIKFYDGITTSTSWSKHKGKINEIPFLRPYTGVFTVIIF